MLASSSSLFVVDLKGNADIVRLLFMVPIYALISFASFLFWVRKYTRQSSFDLISPRTESLHSPHPCSRLLRGRRSHLILLPSPYLPFSEPGGTKGSLSPQWIISRERPPTQEERPETSEMGLAPRLHQVQASGKFLQLAVPRALLREASSGRVVFSPNHEMGRASVLCDKTNVSVLRGTPVAVHSAQLRTSLAAVILEYMGLYCEASWSPGWGHLYVSPFTLVGPCGADQVSRSW